ncbi:cation-transporting ATPase [Microbacterium sp. 179-I 3D4 NHS]|uniref:cation-transporting ATPase n=1 Tax=Microbacterium sp. 179-I 3D4 NHS TaxID=3142381 RepID=UPI0039A0BE1F
MGRFSRLLGLAAEALDKTTHSGTPLPDRRPARQDPAPPTAASAARPTTPGGYAPPPAPASARPSSRASTADRAAIARYDYLLQTADPHRVEEIHREAFARLTPDQRAQVQQRMSAEFPAHDRPASASPEHLARAAGRAEAARPGRMKGILARVGGAGVAGVAGGAAVGVLGAVAGGAVLSAAAGPLLEQAAGLGVDFDAWAQGIDAEALVGGVDVEGLTGAADGLLGSAGEAVAGAGEAASGWGERLGDLGLPDIRDLFGR